MPPGQPAVASRVLAHYAGCAALLDASFAGAPIVFADFPRGFHAPPRFRVTQIPLSTARIGWLVQREYAVEFHGWAPDVAQPEYLRFGRVVLEPRGEAGFPDVRDAALRVREELAAIGCDAIAVVDGIGGIVLWIPFAQPPAAAKIRARLMRLCARVAPHAPSVRLDATVNTPGRYTVLPYSLRGTPALPVATPTGWTELAKQRAPVVSTAETWREWHDSHGDVFARASVALGSQRFRARRSRDVADSAH